MHHKTLRIAAACLALLAATASYAQTLSKGDQRILKQLAQANMAEVAAANIALKKSPTPDRCPVGAPAFSNSSWLNTCGAAGAAGGAAGAPKFAKSSLLRTGIMG